MVTVTVTISKQKGHDGNYDMDKQNSSSISSNRRRTTTLILHQFMTEVVI